MWSDAWILAAIMVHDPDRFCSLTDVVAAADAINHAIPGEDEVAGAVGKLVGAGLVSVQAGEFELTASGRAMAAARRGGMMRQVDHLLRALRRLPVNERS